MDIYCYRQVEKWAQRIGPVRSVVDFGSFDCNGSVRSLFQGIPYTGIDLDAGPGVDMVADAATFTPDEAPDLVLCLSVLEHTPKRAEIVANAHRILAPGGWLILAAPAIGYPTHGSKGQPLPDGEYYRNVTEAELLEWAACFEWIEMDEGGGLYYVLAQKGSHAG